MLAEHPGGLTAPLDGRIGIHCRALGVLADDEMVWFRVGAHDDYERRISLR